MSIQPLVVGARIDAQNPWPGLSAFDEAAQHFFHGRDDESAELLRLVGQAPLTVLFSKSGLGKTSLVQAGLFPRLRQQNILPVYVRLDVRDRSAPLLQQAVAALQTEISKHGIDATATNASESLWEHLHGRYVQWWSPKNQPLLPLFVFDQFEEVFTLGAENTDAIKRLWLDLADLIENRIPLDLAQRIETSDLAEQLDLRGQRYKVLLSFREDFLPEVEGWKGELPSLMRNRLRLLPMNADRAVQVVSGDTPTGRTHELMNDDTAREIIHFVATVQTRDEKTGRSKSLRKAADPPWDKLEIEPALLSLVCKGLNEKRKARAQATIDAALLHDTGSAIIGDFYQRCVVDVPDQTRRFIEDTLITEGGFRNSYPLQDAVDQGALTEPLLQQLVNCRLLRIDHQLGADRIELIHDRLTDVVREYRDKERERVQRQKRMRYLAGSVFVGSLLIGALFFFIILWQRARTALEIAKSATIVRRVSQAETEFKISPTRGLLLAVEALNLSRRNQITCVKKIPCVEFTAQALVTMLSQTGGTPLIGHQGPVSAVSFSADGKLLATVDDHVVKLWRIDQLKTSFAKLPLPYIGGGTVVSFSRDNKLLATANFGQVDLWRIDEPQSLSLFYSFPQELDNMSPTSASFSPNGKLVLTTRGMKARVWQLDQLEKPVATWGINSSFGKNTVKFASFTSDGKFIVTIDDTGKVWQWQLDQLDHNYKPVLLPDLKVMIGNVSFSSDGKHLVIPSQLNTENLQSTVRYINLDDPATFKDKPGERLGGLLRAASLSTDGKLVVSADDDGTVRVWQVDKPDKPFAVLRGHEGQVYAASFSPDDKFIATAGRDGTVRIWQVHEPMAIAKHEDGSLPDWTTCLDELTELARKTAGRDFTREEWSQFFPDAEYHHTFPGLPAPTTEEQD